MWIIIGWIIWSTVIFLIIWSIFGWRIKAKSGEEFDWKPYVSTPFLLIISILFLIFDWHKLHLLWILPIVLLGIPSLVIKKIPVASPLILSITRIFQNLVLVGIKRELTERKDETEVKEENDEDESNIEDENNLEEKIQVVKQDPLGRYKRIREIGQSLTGKMMKHVPRFVLTKAASELNLRGPKGVLVFDSESDTSFMMDRCFFDMEWDGKNLISHFIESDDYERLTEEEKAIVQGMTTAYYSLFEVANIDPYIAILKLDDLLGENSYTIMDINLSRTARIGYLLAARIHKTEGIYMTTGAVCPFEGEQKEYLLSILKSRRTSGRKRKTKRLQRSDYSAYFFKQFNRIGEIKFLSVDELE